jgi:GTP cyclohydrolase IA
MTESYQSQELETAVPEAAQEGTAAARKANLMAAIRIILSSVGEDPEREGLLGTPDRIARMYEEVLAGYHVDPVALVNEALFQVEYDEMIIVKDIEFFSLCEHHMLPFFGRAHVAYIPRDQIIGLSKIPRIVEMFARRLQVQERMTRQIADLIEEVLNPLGVAVVLEASHMCSMMRGVKKEHARMVTSAMLGSFRNNQKTRNEFMNHLRRGPTSV